LTDLNIGRSHREAAIVLQNHSLSVVCQDSVGRCVTVAQVPWSDIRSWTTDQQAGRRLYIQALASGVATGAGLGVAASIAIAYRSWPRAVLRFGEELALTRASVAGVLLTCGAAAVFGLLSLAAMGRKVPGRQTELRIDCSDNRALILWLRSQYVSQAAGALESAGVARATHSENRLKK
jgi:hypothetical protein